MPLAFGEVDAVDEQVYLLDAEYLGELHAYLGRFEQQGGIGLDIVFEYEEAVEGAYPREHPGLGAWGYLLVVEACEEMFEVLQLGIQGIYLLLFEVGEQACHVMDVGIQRIGRQRFLKQQVLLVAVYDIAFLFFHRREIVTKLVFFRGISSLFVVFGLLLYTFHG